MRRYLAGAFVVLLFPTSAHAATRYASPDGIGTACTQAAPCDAREAITKAANGDEVILGTGTYGSPSSSPVTYFAPVGVTIRGEDIGPARPVLYAGLQLSGATSSVRDLDVRQLGTARALNLTHGATADRVVARLLDATYGDDGCHADDDSSIRNALCTEAGSNFGSGVGIDGGQSPTPAAGRNITAIGASHGAFVSNGRLDAVIAQGGAGQDLYAYASPTTVNDVLYLDRIGSPNSDSGRINAAPVFAGADDYRQGEGSPTIDAGDLEDAVVAPGELDLNGNLRKLGSHVDVGAYEHVPLAPEVSALTRTAAGGVDTFSATIQPFGGRTDWHVEYGSTTAYGSSTPTRSFLGTLSDTPISIAVPGFADGTHYRLVATTDGGTTATADQVVSAPAPAPPAPTTTPNPSPVPPPAKPTFSAGAGGGKRGAQLLLSRKTITLFVNCGGVACRVTASGYVTIGRKRYGTLRSASKRLAANTAGYVKVGSTLKLRHAVRVYLRRHKRAKPKIHLTGVFVGDDGSRVTKKLTIGVRRLK